jgi:hypothetical protein
MEPIPHLRIDVFVAVEGQCAREEQFVKRETSNVKIFPPFTLHVSRLTFHIFSRLTQFLFLIVCLF